MSVTYAERFEPQILPIHLILGPGLVVLVPILVVLAGVFPTAAIPAYVLAGLCAVAGAVGTVWAFWLRPRRQRVSVAVGPDGLRAAVGTEPATRVAWPQVTRVQAGPRSLLFDVGTDVRPGRLVVSAPTPRFPSDGLCRAIGAALDASRGYQGKLCDATGEPAADAMAHGGCSSPLGCAGSESCALHALKTGVGESPA